jgi:hypothetical protein
MASNLGVSPENFDFEEMSRSADSQDSRHERMYPTVIAQPDDA